MLQKNFVPKKVKSSAKIDFKVAYSFKGFLFSAIFLIIINNLSMYFGSNKSSSLLYSILVCSEVSEEDFQVSFFLISNTLVQVNATSSF